MARKGQPKEKAPKDCRQCEHWDQVRTKVRVNELLEQTLGQFEDKIKKAGYEPTVAEYMKLLQLGEELAQEDEAKEIKVTWVRPDTTSDTEK
jgi:hypothetical protein